jgi:hypothetical protein
VSIHCRNVHEEGYVASLTAKQLKSYNEKLYGPTDYRQLHGLPMKPSDILDQIKATSARLKGVVLGRRNYRKGPLQDLAKIHTIQLETSVPIMEEGWVNKPKGLRQVLWERGFINERHWKKYKLTRNKKNDFNDDGSLKEESKPYILSELMATCADFSFWPLADVQTINVIRSYSDRLDLLMYNLFGSLV